MIHPESPFSKGQKQKFMHQEFLSLKKTTNPSESPNSPRQLKDLFSDRKVKKEPNESISPQRNHPQFDSLRKRSRNCFDSNPQLLNLKGNNRNTNECFRSRERFDSQNLKKPSGPINFASSIYSNMRQEEEMSSYTEIFDVIQVGAVSIKDLFADDTSKCFSDFRSVFSEEDKITIKYPPQLYREVQERTTD